MGKKIVIVTVLIVGVAAVVLYALVTGNETQCWNRVIPNRTYLYWPDGCKGARPSNDRFCTQAMVELSNDERAGYEGWVAKGKPEIPGC